MRSGTTWNYFLTDHLGSVVAVTDSAGAVLAQTRYSEFGEIRTDIGTVTQTDFGYTFQRNLPDTGLMDYKARMYDPLLGRFIQPDTLVPGAGNPQMFNRYAYVKNNPINFSDPTGHKECNEYDENGNCISDPDVKNANSKEKQLPPVVISDDILSGLNYANDHKDEVGEYESVDCTNFVSLVWNAAGVNTTNVWSPGSEAWINAPKFVEYWSSQNVMVKKFTNHPGTLLENNSNLINQLKQTEIPLLSIVAYDNDLTSNEWDHLAVVVGYDRNGLPIIDEHSGPYFNESNPNNSINQRSMFDTPNSHIGRIWIIFLPENK